MKKRIVILAAALCMLMGMTALADNDINVYINENKVEFSDRTPMEIDGELFLPLRSIFEAMGAEVFWTGETSTVIFAGADVKAILQIGNDILFKDIEQFKMKSAPVIVDDRTMVTADAVENVFGLTAAYDSKNGIIRFEVK